MWCAGRKREGEPLGRMAAAECRPAAPRRGSFAARSDAATLSPVLGVCLFVAGFVCVLAGCGSDVHPTDRAAAAALREAGARLELDHAGRISAVIVTDTPLDDEQLECMAGLDSVRFLRLESTGITDAGLQHVQGLASLEEISLYRTHVTSAGLEFLRGLTNLKNLGLNETEINDAGLKHLAGLKNLQHLWLDGTAVSDAGLPSLNSLKQLKDLGLRNTRATKAAVAGLRRVLPATTIYD